MPNGSSGRDLQIMEGHLYVKLRIHGVICITKCQRAPAALVNMCINNFDMFRRKSGYNFTIRLCKSTNAVVSSILQCIYFIHGSCLLAA